VSLASAGLGGASSSSGTTRICAASTISQQIKSFDGIQPVKKAPKVFPNASVALEKSNMSEHEEKLKQEPRLLVQRTGDVHLARVGGQQLVHHTDSDGKEIVYSEAVQASGVYLPESEARRLAANGSVMIVKDIHGQETFEEGK
jgi:hypothetical protein